LWWFFGGGSGGFGDFRLWKWRNKGGRSFPGGVLLVEEHHFDGGREDVWWFREREGDFNVQNKVAPNCSKRNRLKLFKGWLV
jgi:hypothetical protein